MRSEIKMKYSKKMIAIIVLSIMLISLSAFSVSCLPVTGAENGAAETGTAAADEPTGFAAIFGQYGTWVWLAILVVAFYFLLIRPQRTRSKKAQDLVSSLARGDEVITAGGFHGRIKDIRDDFIVITIASGVDVKVNKSSVSKKVTPQK